MKGKNHAGIHTRRNDRNGRPSGSRRRTSVHWTANAETAARARAYERATDALVAALDEAAETGDESLDGLYPDETPQA